MIISSVTSRRVEASLRAFHRSKIGRESAAREKVFCEEVKSVIKIAPGTASCWLHGLAGTLIFDSQRLKFALKDFSSKE